MRAVSLVDHTRKHPPGAGDLDAIAAALTVQVERDFAPAWGVRPVPVTVGGRGEKLHFFDSAHAAGDMGWHQVDAHGRPYAHVYSSPSIAAGSGWVQGPDAISTTASHEVLELLVDPGANAYVFDGERRLWAQEVCDAVQAGTYGIRVGHTTVAVSNFVLPAFFNPWAPPPYDHLGVLERPFSIAKGGYAMVERATADLELDARTGRPTRARFEVVFDAAVPEWQRATKLHGFGRTWWRLALAP
ncbi:MAG: hypothetical protein U0W40_18325 [Acidimicrobiia bacterium]